MTEISQENFVTIHVLAYDPNWPNLFMAERELLLAATTSGFVALEHIGSTAIPGLSAKPIIDMMAAVTNLPEGVSLIPRLVPLGYQRIENGMPGRLFLRKYAPKAGITYHLHIVEFATWNERNERVLRDYLRAHSEAAQAYGELKMRLAVEYSQDGLAYTKAKTAFIQSIIDQRVMNMRFQE